MIKQLNITALKHGVMIGGICAIISFILIMIGRITYLDFYGTLTLVTGITLVLSFGKRERRENHEDQLKYTAAWVYATIVLFVVNLMVQLAHVGICQLIDPGIQELVMTRSMEGVEKGLEIVDRVVELDGVDMDKMLDEAENEVKRSYAISSLFTNSFSYLILSGVIGAILAIFIKKSKPDFAEE